MLDFCGPYEVLTAVRTDVNRPRDSRSPFEVFLISNTLEPVTTSGKMRVLPDFSFQNHPPLDLLIVPGGWGTRALLNDKNTTDWIFNTSKKAGITASVCTGALLLGKAGLLANKRATTHWKSLDLLEQLFPGTKVERNSRVVKDGNVFTSAGISAGIDLALILASSYFGEEIAKETAKHMEYPFPTELLGKI